MIDMQIAASRIATARREKGFTQEELSQRLGVTVQAISKWERAQSLPDIGLMLDLSRILGITIEYLFGDDTPHAQGKSHYDGASSEILDGLQSDPILVEVGIDFAKAIMPDFLKNIPTLRRKVFMETGVLLPRIRIRDNMKLANTQCRIRIHDETIVDNVFPDTGDATLNAMLSALSEAIRTRLSAFINRHMVKLLIERLREELPFAVEGVIPERVGLTQLTRVVRALVLQGKSAYNLLAILETLDDGIDLNVTETVTITALMASLPNLAQATIS